MHRRFPLLFVLAVLIVFSAPGSAHAQCQPTLPTIVPFASLSTWGVVGPNTAGDYLMIGNISGPVNYSAIPLPSAINQRFCSTIPLFQDSNPNFFSYVPTAAERVGDFSAFAAQLSAIAGFPYPSGIFAPDAAIWGWRVPAGESVFFSNNAGRQILKLDGNIGALPGPTGNIPGLQLVSSGPVCEFACFQPKDLTIGPDNRIYAADTNNDAIFRMDQTGGSFESVLSCTGSPCPLTPRALAFSGSSAQDLYFLDGGGDSTNDVFRIAGAGATPFETALNSPTVVIPSFCVLPSTFCTNGDQLDHGLAFDADDNLIFGDLTHNSVWTSLPPYNSSLSTSASVASPLGIALNRGTGQAFVISGSDILPVGSELPYYTFSAPDTPSNMQFDASGYLYVTTEQSISAPFHGRLWRIDPGNGTASATLLADLNSLIATEIVNDDEALGVAVAATSGPTKTATLHSTSGSFTFSWDGGRYTFGVQYPSGMFPEGSTAIVTPTETTEAAWASRTCAPPNTAFCGTQIAPVAGENGDGIIFSAQCVFNGSPCPVPSDTTLSYTVSTTWKSSQSAYCSSGPGLLKADPIGSDNWVNTLTTCTILSPDPTYGTKGTSSCTSTSCLSDWANIFGIKYTFVGFASPVSSTATNLVKAGQAVPIQFQAFFSNGEPVLNLTMPFVSISSGSILCDSTDIATDLIDSTSTGNSGFQNLGGGNYQFNWATSKSWSGTCRQLQLDLGDGVLHTANFKFK